MKINDILLVDDSLSHLLHYLSHNDRNAAPLDQTDSTSFRSSMKIMYKILKQRLDASAYENLHIDIYVKII